MDVGQRVAIVTGGASGIGRSLCLALARRDAAGVVVADVDAAGAAEGAAGIEAGGHRAPALTAGVSNAAAAEAPGPPAGGRFGGAHPPLPNARNVGPAGPAGSPEPS